MAEERLEVWAECGGEGGGRSHSNGGGRGGLNGAAMAEGRGGGRGWGAIEEGKTHKLCVCGGGWARRVGLAEAQRLGHWHSLCGRRKLHRTQAPSNTLQKEEEDDKRK